MATRRDFLKGGALLGAAAAFGTAGARADEVVLAVDRSSVVESGPSQGLGLEARILCLGNLGYFRPDLVSKDALSVLDLKTGAWRTIAAATVGGHQAFPLKAGGVVLMPRYNGAIELRNSDLSSRRVVRLPGYAFSGHCHEADGCLLLAAERTDVSEGGGVILKVSLETGDLLAVAPSGGVHPHDIVALPGNRMAVSHYGIRWENQIGEGGGAASFMFENPMPLVSILDVDSLSIERLVALPGNYAATHIAAGSSGTIWTMPLQYRLFADHEALSDGVSPGITLRQDEWKARRCADGLPIVAIDSATGAVRNFDLGASLQRRGQSIAVNAGTGRVVATFPYSDTIWIHDPVSGLTEARRAFDVGIHAVRGVADIPSTSWIAVCGEWEGVSIVDVTSWNVIARYAMPTFWTSHISAQAT